MPEVISQTDHKALIYLQNQPKLSIRQANLVEWLQQFNIKIEYLPGLYNFLADHLSRNPEFTPTCPRCQETFTLSREVKPIEVNQSEVVVPFDTKKIAIEIEKEFPDCAGQPDKLERHWTFTEGLLYYLGKLFIPTSVRIDLLHDHHSVAQAGHLGFQKTLNRLLPLYYWPTMRKDCYNFIKKCDPCQRSKKSNQPTRTILKTLPVPIERFRTVQMDFFPTPRDSAGYNSVMIIVDKLQSSSIYNLAIQHPPPLPSPPSSTSHGYAEDSQLPKSLCPTEIHALLPNFGVKSLLPWTLDLQCQLPDIKKPMD
jgi:hypothetical protein